jgi:hypothetical protein
MEDRTLLSTFTVTNTGDSGPGSFRQAILDSNAATGQTNTIDFTISGSGVQTIAPLSSLPTITNPVQIDGESQPGYSGTPVIELTGTQAGTGDGLTITRPDVTVRGLDIGGFSQGAGIHITGTSVNGDWIYGNLLGTDPTGTQALPNNDGVEIDGGATHNLIGTNGDGVNDAAERNVISGNLLAGVWITGQGTDGNVVAGNFMGTSASGSVGLANGTQWYSDPQGYWFGGGVVIVGGASNNRIGTDGRSVDDVGERNVIAASGNDGIDIYGAGTDGNIVAGNFIGTDLTGTVSSYMPGAGVQIGEGASSNWIGVNPDGGAAVGDEGNLLSGIGFCGVLIGSSNSNIVAGNKIGTDATGTVALGSYNGIALYSSASNTIGGTTSDASNLISGNQVYGLAIYGGDDNVCSGNKIGTDVTGTVALGNQGEGVLISSSHGNTIGGAVAGAADVISGNGSPGGFFGYSGVEIQDSSDNVVEGDFIGTDATGTIALGNQQGVSIDTSNSTSTGNTIGGTSASAGNLITDNKGPGVTVTGDGSVGNQITANRIFGNTGQAIDLGGDGVTDNATSPRQGPNNLQNFPLIVTTGDGLEGRLVGSTPETTFRIDVFASAAYGPRGAGEAQDYLGSLEVTTDATGRVTFAVPFSAPAGLPIITATATDPQGNTSEVTSVVSGGFQAQSQIVRLGPGQQSRTLSAASGNGISLQDSAAGSSGSTWEMSLLVSAGTVTLSSTAGLIGSGDGTGSLVYTGTLSALNAALDGMTYTLPPGFQGNVSLSVDAQSDGISLIAGRILITTDSFAVTTTADSGPGSLRQAILDSNAVTGGTNTIDFAIPGQGVQTIALASPLPPITRSVLVDGTTQPGYAGTPLIAFGGLSPGSPGPLVISGGNVTIRGLALESVAIDATAGEGLIAVVATQGAASQLSLVDAHGHVLVQSDGASADNPNDVIDQYLAAGLYSLAVDSRGGQGTYTWTTMLMPSSAPFQAAPLGSMYPAAYVAGDFTGDGHLDLAVAGPNYDLGNSSNNTYPGDVWLLLGNGDGTFQPPVLYPTGLPDGLDPTAMVAEDFTGDGHLDLAVVSSGGFDQNGNPNPVPGDVSILLGNGDGTFQPAVQYAVGVNPVSIAAGEFTGDGRLDLAVANSNDNTVSVLLGKGDGTFRPQVTYAVGSGPNAIVAGDFTGDGRADIAVTNYSDNTVSVLLSNRDGTFQPQVTYAVGANPSDIVAGDFAGNGHLDLAVTGFDFSTYEGEVSVLLGKGDGTFQPQVIYRVASGSEPTGVVAGDFRGNGKLDLAVSDGAAQLLLGNGDGTFQPAITVPGIVNYGNSLVAGDFNGDGRSDLAFFTYVSYPLAKAAVSILLGNGDGTFQSSAQNTTGSNPYDVVAGDFTGNGHLDLAICNGYGNSVSVLLGNGDGTFQPAVQYPVGLYPGWIVAGDFNGDGRLDLAVSDNEPDGFTGEVQVLLGNGDGTFQSAKTIMVLPPTAYGNGHLVAGDFTGNGHLDLAMPSGDYKSGTGEGEVWVVLGNGDGTFQPAVEYPTGASAPTGRIADAIVAGDFNGDGKLDLAVTNELYTFSGSQGWLPGTVSVLLGNGDGTFQPAVQYGVGAQSAAMVAGNFTGSGHLDLAVDNVVDNTVSVLLGNGDGTFKPHVTYRVGSSSYAIVAGNFTGDGHTDLAVADGNDNKVWILLGNGDGTFTPQVPYAVGSIPTAMVAGDFEGAGHLDLAITTQANVVSILLGNGDGTFVDPSQIAAALHGTPLVADVNGDGTDDVLIVDGHGNILYRQGIPGQPGSFAPPVTINPNNPSRDIAWLPNTDQGPVLASVDARDDGISFYGYRDGQFVQIGSLDTGRLPAQIIAADLNGDGFTDLVVRNAGDGSLSVYFGAPVADSHIVGPMGSLEPPTFLPAVTLPVGLGVSDVRAVDTTGSGTLDLVVTNKLTSLVSVLYNEGNGLFAAPVPYRAGTGLSAIDPSSTPEVTSLEATAGVAAGPLTPGRPSSLATINPGSHTLDILANLGGGRFANPVTIETQGAAEVVRMADFTGNGISDLAVLTAQGVSVYLGDGKGGFSSPVTYDAGVDPTGLTVADVLGNGKLDLLVGNAYGDVLILVGNGDGTFRPFEPVKADIALAVADLTGNGALDFVFADQSLNRVTVVYGSTSQSSTSPQVIGNQATGVLAPGAVKLADLTGDGIPDLIVANSGGNNVLVYPGLGNGQFGPPVNGTKGFPVGTDPTGLAVANLNGQPDLLVADTGSNDVSVLLGQGSGSSWTMISGPRIQTDAGPVALALGNLLGGTQTDLAVANSGADNVQIFPGAGGGFFKPATNPILVGQAPSSLFLGNFTGLGLGLATLNAGSNDGTLISGLNSASPTTQTFPTGGNSPTSGFAGDFTGDGLTDLVVGNNGDGHLALLLGGSGGLSLSQTLVSAEAPNPTSLSFAGVSDGQLSFYVSTAGREAAMNLAFNLEGGGGLEAGTSPLAPTSTGESSPSAVLSQATSGSVQQVSQLLSLTGTTLDLAATLLTVSVVSIESESGTGGGLASVGTTGLGQPVIPAKGNGGSGGSAEEPSTEDAESGAAGTPVTIESLPAWERLSIGLGRAWEKARAAILRLEGQEPAASDSQSSARPAVSRPPRPPVAEPGRPATRAGTETGARPAASGVPVAPASETSDRAPASVSHVIDAALEDLGSESAVDEPSAGERWGLWDVPTASEPTGTARALVAVVASVSVVGAVGTWSARWLRRRRLASTSLG